VYTGYRGQFHLHGLEDIADVEWHLSDVEYLNPGDSGRCQIWFARPEVHLPKIKVGDTFEIREGRRVVARGHVVGALPDSGS
jgi:GTPase